MTAVRARAEGDQRAFHDSASLHALAWSAEMIESLVPGIEAPISGDDLALIRAGVIA